MNRKENKESKIEIGDIYFFYRVKMSETKVSGLNEIQRFYMCLLPDEAKKGRLFVVGKKKLPDIIPGKSESTERNWLLNVLVDKPEGIGKEIGPEKYETSKDESRRRSEAIPVGQGRYCIYEDDDQTKLAYRLESPREVGKAQREMNIKNEAIYAISVKNPSVKVKGFPDEEPGYPKTLQKLFHKERWLPVKERKLLDYEDVQVLMVGAKRKLADEKVTISGRANLFKKLGLNKSNWPTEALYEGQLASATFKPRAHKPSGDYSKGGKIGGTKALKTASAAGVARALKGIDFPEGKSGLVDYAKQNKAPDEVVATLMKFPKRKFKTMAEVQKQLGGIR